MVVVVRVDLVVILDEWWWVIGVCTCVRVLWCVLVEHRCKLGCVGVCASVRVCGGYVDVRVRDVWDVRVWGVCGCGVWGGRGHTYQSLLNTSFITLQPQHFSIEPSTHPSHYSLDTPPPRHTPSPPSCPLPHTPSPPSTHSSPPHTPSPSSPLT